MDTIKSLIIKVVVAIALIAQPGTHSTSLFAVQNDADKEIAAEAWIYSYPMLFNYKSLYEQTPQDRAALRSLYEKLTPNADNTIDLYFGPKAPAGKSGRWIQTIPGRGWFAYFRIYGPKPAAFDGSWKPGDFEEVK